MTYDEGEAGPKDFHQGFAVTSCAFRKSQVTRRRPIGMGAPLVRVIYDPWPSSRVVLVSFVKCQTHSMTVKW